MFSKTSGAAVVEYSYYVFVKSEKKLESSLEVSQVREGSKVQEKIVECWPDGLLLSRI